MIVRGLLRVAVLAAGVAVLLIGLPPSSYLAAVVLAPVLGRWWRRWWNSSGPRTTSPVGRV